MSRLLARLKISHHAHTGRLRPHEYTSYLPLAILLVITGLALTVCSASASPGPAAGSVAINGKMPGPPPAKAASITSPKDGQHFSTTPITVAGTCTEGTLIEVYKNDIFAGSGSCKDGGSFSFEVDLLIGKNILVARTYDALNQAGPDSAAVTVYYDALPAQGSALSSLDFGGAQLLLITDAVYRGMWPGKEFNVPITVLGGRAPYAINIEWGDSTNKVISRPDNQVFNAPHTYKKPGTYQISFQGTDSQGRVAFLTVAAIVNGQPTGTTAAGATKAKSKLFMLWPIFACAVVMVVSFWLGERREKKILARHAVVYT